LGLPVLAHDPFPSPEWAEEHHIRYISIEELLQSRNILFLHVPLLPETHHLLNKQTLSQLQPGSIILNTSRGKLIDTTTLIQAFKSEHIGGVVLDLYE
jgi:D-lactate dehydrogenase